MKKKYVIVGIMMLLIGMVGVNAATSVPSNGVLYSNSNSSVTTVEGALNELYTNYNNLLSKGDASAANILTGKKVLVKGKEVTGTMANNGSVSKALAAGGSYTIPKGYHDGTGKVTANSLASQTSATATAADILSGKTAYVNGSKITGTMTSYASNGYYHVSKDNIGIASNNIYLRFPKGAYLTANKTGYVEAWTEASNLGISANKIAKGQTIAGITGTYSGSNTIPNLEACLKIISARGWDAASKLSSIIRINVGGSVSYDMNGASTRVVNNSNSNHLGTNLNSTYGYIDGTNYIQQTNSGTTNTIKGLKRGAALLEIDYGTTCGKHLIIVW